jgi:ABC-type transport system involved in multi-copper enzyme maturation permease subunit
METALIVTGIVATLAGLIWYICARSTIALLYAFTCGLLLSLGCATIVQNSIAVTQLEGKLNDQQARINGLEFALTMLQDGWGRAPGGCIPD